MVELIGVTGGYGRQMAVQDFSLTLPSGEVAALVGPNGCGKSTLLRMAAGIVPPSAGQVLLKGRPLSGFSRRDQLMLALLVRGHRRNIPKDRFAEFGDDGVQLLRLCVLLRFAILFHHIRGTQEMPKVQLKAGPQSLDLTFPDGWLAANPLTQADFEQEAEWLTRLGFVLTVR